MFKWRLYYEDGSTFTDHEGSPWDSPHFGVIGVAQPFAADRFKTRLFDGDYFIYRTDYNCWLDVNLDGLLDHLTDAAQYIVAVRPGRLVLSTTWHDMMKQMVEDLDGQR
jgi:hypothetical protein